MNKTIRIVSKKIDVILRNDLIPFLQNNNFNSYKYPLSEPIYDNKELSSAIESLISLNISSGKKVRIFEENFAKYIGCKYAVAVNSGSSANLISLASLIERYNLKKGDEVIIPASTFATVAMPIIQLGLKPVFVDIDLNNLNISVEKIKKAISNRTKIIMPVHTLGYPCDMRNIIEIAKKKKILIFEDCCEAHGAAINKKKVGSFGDISAFSFFVAHNITTGEGGMILTNEKKLFEIAKSLREFGRIKLSSLKISQRFYTDKKLKDYDKRYVFQRLGYNFRMTDIAASLGIEQLKKLNKFNIQRRNNANLITDLIVKKFNKYFINFKYNKNYTHSYYTYAFLLKKNIHFSRKDICVFLEKNGIETRPLFAGCLPDQPAFVNKKIKVFDLVSSRYVKENLFFIGVHPKINYKNINYLSKKIESFLLKFDEK